MMMDERLSSIVFLEKMDKVKSSYSWVAMV
jgi:hypothetical protein